MIPCWSFWRESESKRGRGQDATLAFLSLVFGRGKADTAVAFSALRSKAAVVASFPRLHEPTGLAEKNMPETLFKDVEVRQPLLAGPMGP